MDISSYFSARELVESLGQPLLILAFVLSIGLLLFGLHPKLQGRTQWLLLAIFLVLLTGYGLLIWFHVQIYNFLPLKDPSSGTIFGRYMIPPWIENEKLYFWSLLTSIWLLFVREKPVQFRAVVYSSLPILLFLTLATSNPFKEPLGSFNQQILGIEQVLNTQDAKTQGLVLYQASQMLKGFYNSAYMWMHPPLLFFSYSAFVVGFFGSLFMLFKRQKEYDEFAYNWAKAGYTVLTLGLLIGYPWTVQAWKGQPWWFSPKVNVTIMMWVLYTAFIHTRVYLNRKGMWRTTAILGVLSFSAVVVTYLSTYVLPGIHSVGGR